MGGLESLAPSRMGSDPTMHYEPRRGDVSDVKTLPSVRT